ncbi:hypothetical protein GCM10011514_15290 [Emticicia aquatilis]|uniref:DUF4260 family protein n=1 Tax=Emticicia aquatilis TaxID=1537369 RepID=A0A916YM06_9BACT|nr:DUF4260 domain-containing protein [Emticicia aquatilis]GGD51979.1 hypothetical protein GCM10011514_15290 [Emticicia aquatilis]
MKKLLILEEIAQFLLGIFLFSQLNFAWWWFPALILVPDFSMVGYLINPKIGAWLYNFFHHKLLAVIVFVLGYYVDSQYVILAGVILFAHSAMDRIFGYGLKYEDAFSNTHLGKIGK